MDLVKKIRSLGHEALRVKSPRLLRAGGLVVNWGDRSGRPDALNVRGFFSKYNELRELHRKGVPVVAFTDERPDPPDGWLPRLNGHHEGNDLLRRNPILMPDYWTRFENLSPEFRVHVMRLDGEMRSIRLGMKFPRVDDPHPWVRSWSAGWHLLYNQEAQNQADRFRNVRKVAKDALTALGLDFGAVDVAIHARSGKPLVLEVNRAPGIEGRTLEVYAQKFIQIAGDR